MGGSGVTVSRGGFVVIVIAGYGSEQLAKLTLRSVEEVEGCVSDLRPDRVVDVSNVGARSDRYITKNSCRRRVSIRRGRGGVEVLDPVPV